MTVVLGGVPIQVTFGFCLLLAVVAWRDWMGAVSRLLLAVALHEGAHLFFLLLFGVKLQGITFSSVGIEVSRPADQLPRWKEAVVLIAGPGINLLLFFLFRTRLPGLRLMDRFFFFANLMLGCFNLLPLPPLDGGNLLVLLLEKYLSPAKAAQVILVLGSGLLLLLLPAAVALLYYKGNITLLLTWGYLTLLLWKNRRGEG